MKRAERERHKFWASASLPDKAAKLNRLHRRIQRHEQDMLKLARTSGRLLLEVKAVKKHGTWQQWIYNNYDGSYDTARDYMRVAKNWNSEPAKESRRKGRHFDSIKSFLDFVKENRHTTPDKIRTERQQKEYDYRHNAIRDMVVEKTNELDDFEFKILYKNFEHFWSKLDDELKAILWVVYEYDPYDYDTKAEKYELKKQAREIVARRMSRKKRKT